MPREKGNWQIKKTTVVLIAAVAFVILATILLPNQDIRPAAAAGPDMLNEVDGYWWAPNGGWISMQWDDQGDCADCVQIDKSPMLGPPIFTGYAWGPNIGWISMQDKSGAGQYQVALRIKLAQTGPWPVDGFAWGPNIGWVDFDAIDAWDHKHPAVWSPGGPLSADEPQIKVDATNPEDANMAGYAWSPNFGWINLSFATVPGWKDTTPPTLEYFDVEPEAQPLPPAEKYTAGVYKEEDPNGCCGGAYNFNQGHLVWVGPGIKFKTTMHSQDNHTRAQDLNISVVTAEPQTLPVVADYIWWDRIQFRPKQTPLFVGNVKSYTGEFLPNPDYAAGTNPNVPKTGDEVKVPSEEDINGDGKTETIWKSATHLLSQPLVVENPGAVGYVLREFRYDVRDTGGNYACPTANPPTFDWETGQGCVIPGLDPDYSPMTGRIGAALDKIKPAGSLYIGATDLPDEEAEKPPTHISATDKIDFKVEYIDTESGSYHVILDYQKTPSGGGSWSDPIGERRWNRYRNPESWIIDGVINPAAETETETPLNTSDWADGQTFTLRLRAFDNVGNMRERKFPAVIDRTPPAVTFYAHDPIDDNPSRTRYNAADLIIPVCPAADDCATMQFSNNGHDFTKADTYKPGRFEDWFLNWPGTEDVTGGLKTIYGRFCDNTEPYEVCADVPTTINAPWFEGAQGDVYGRSGVGTRDAPQFEGIAPYLGVDVQKFNATYRITSGGVVKPQITSAQGWTEGNYHEFGYPGINVIGTVAPIDFESLKTDAVTLYDDVLANDQKGELDFITNPVIWLKTKLLNGDPTLYSNKKDRLTIIGTGTLLVDGNLQIKTDLYYQDNPPVSAGNKVDSMAVLTNRNNKGRQGNVYVGQNVAHIVGAYIIGLGENSIYQGGKLGSGTFHSSVLLTDISSKTAANITGPVTEGMLQPSGHELVVEGMVAARDFNLGRYSTGNQNFLTNGSLEGRPCSDWTCAGAGIFGTSGENVVAGDQKLQITLKPNQTATLSQNGILLGLSGKISLTLSGYLRSNFKLVPKNVIKDVWVGNKSCLFQPDDKDIRIDSQWRRFQCTVSVDNGALPIGVTITAVNTMKPPPPIPPSFTLDLDAWQLEAGDEATEWHDKFGADTNYMAAEKFVYDGRVIISTPPGLFSTSGTSWEEGVAD